jgi:hypothetical protein
MSRLTDRHQEYLLAARFKLTPPQVEQAVKFRGFCRERLAIDIHVGQLAFAGLVLARDAKRPGTAEFLTLLLASGNRAGKTALLAALIIFCCLDKTNKPKPTTEAEAIRWLKSEYHWYHFGIAQEVADLVYSDIVRLLSGNHEGQRGRGCPLTKDGPIARWDSKEYGDYRWIRFAPEAGGAEVHFRTTGEKALGQLGKDMHGVSFDEAGIERNLPFLIKEVFNLRRLGTGGQLIMVSTPSEDLGSDFADMWTLGDRENPRRLAGWCALRMSTRDNIGYGLGQEMFDRLIADMDERTIRQNIEGEFLQAKGAYFNGENVELCFIPDMPVRSAKHRRGVYLQGLDPAKSADSAWTIVLEVVRNEDEPDKPFLIGVYAEQRQGQKSTETLINLAKDAYEAYSDVVRSDGSPMCYTATDATGFGGKMFREAIDLYVPNVTNVEFGGTRQKKLKLLGDLRTLIDEGRLLLPKEGIWLQVRKQLLGYKLEDRKLVQDAVMALVCAVYLLRRAPVDGAQSVEFNANYA